MSKTFKIIAAVLALVMLAGCTVFSVITWSTVRALAQEREQEEEFEDGHEEHAHSENDVRIAEEYVIRATTQISDAYLSGSDAGLSDKDRETLEMASAVLEEIITDGMSDFEKEKAVYDWMVSHLAYDEGALVVIPETDEDCDNPYGVLKYHNAVCVGYATTFRLFMQMLEIPCMVVHNSDLYHSWDLVQLDDHWYHVDVYADMDQGGYGNFNLPDSVRVQQQDWDTEFFPAADALTYNVCWQNRVSVNSVYEVPAALRKAIDQKTSAFAVTFPAGEYVDTDLVEQMVDALYTALMMADREDLPQGIQSWYWVTDEDGTQGLLVSFYYEENSDPDFPEPDDPEALEKANAALQEAFGDLLDVSIYEDHGDWYYTDTEAME